MRIDGYTSEWNLVRSIHIPAFNIPHSVCGLISGDEICVQLVNSATFVINISTTHRKNISMVPWYYIMRPHRQQRNSMW